MRKLLSCAGVSALFTCGAIAVDLGGWTDINFGTAGSDGWPVHAKHMVLDKFGNLIIFGNATLTEYGYSNYGDTSKVYRVRRNTNYTYDLTAEAVNPPTGYTNNNLFCAGHTFLGDGTLFLSGGHWNRPDSFNPGGHDNDWGSNFCNFLEPVPDQTSPTVDWGVVTAGLTFNRWYPTMIQTWNGRFFIIGGTYKETHFADYLEASRPELWLPRVPTSIVSAGYYFNCLGTASDYGDMKRRAYYPFAFQNPNDGTVLYTIKGTPSQFVDGAWHYYYDKKYNIDTCTWSSSILNNYSGSIQNCEVGYSSAVMIQDYSGSTPKAIILKSGGGTVSNVAAVNTTISCDLFAGTPAWAQHTNGMNLARADHTLVALPTGHVLAMGGTYKWPYGPVGQAALDALAPDPDTSGAAANRAAERERCQPELIDALATNLSSSSWTLLQQITDADNNEHRIWRDYHSTSLLLPSADVIIAGGEPEGGFGPPGNRQFLHQNVAQLFSPPYGGTNNWKATRPSITSCPTEIRYGEDFHVGVSFNESRTAYRFALISIGSTTHAFNQNQTVVFMDFEWDSGQSKWKVTPPTTTKVAAPGHYMLFAVDDYLASGGVMKGIPSVAQIVQLKDFDRFFINSTSVPVGSANSGTSLSQLLLQENTYFGNYITTSAGAAEIVGSVYAKSTSAQKIRVNFETRASVGGQWLTVYLYNWTTSQYNQIAQMETTTTDASYYASLTSNASNYIQSPSKIVKVKLRWDADYLPLTFNCYLDWLDVSIRE